MDFKNILKIKGLKYIVVTVVFLVVILFLDDYSLRVSSRLHRQVNELHEEEQALKEAPDLRYPLIVKPVDSAGSKGVSRVDEIRHIDRGYEDLSKTLSALGADVRRI